jgi:hypothetical protein
MLALKSVSPGFSSTVHLPAPWCSVGKKMKSKLIILTLGLALVAAVTGCHTTFSGYGYVTPAPAYYYYPGNYYYPGPGCP